jgi:DNA polymerase III epsilon subunit-like protein
MQVRPVKPPMLVLDLETTGFSPKNNRVALIGTYLVTDDSVKPESAVDTYLKVPYDPQTWGAVYLREEFAELARRRGFWGEAMIREIDAHSGSCLGCDTVPIDVQTEMAGATAKWRTAVDVTGITAPMLMYRGEEPDVVYSRLHQLMTMCHENGIPVVGHNIANFDLPFLNAEFARYGFEPPVSIEGVVDTGMMVKAAQLGTAQADHESVAEFYRRVYNVRRKGLRWALDRHCVGAYGLQKYGVDPVNQHKSAAYDCFVTACLMKELDQPEPVVAAEETAWR